MLGKITITLNHVKNDKLSVGAFQDNGILITSSDNQGEKQKNLNALVLILSPHISRATN